ncbi:serine/threonine protein kinase [Arthroderma uncinatum]|uniref:serine/threonine protein kinase n=1 Tax=Arthroderma uncinatum TaxID=74035 RepID=UPI00144A9728|nr:serine/threonine protein kinase [Arthroderma uncinatum]KAF3484307.1 serine/threonine protein kinase [Arthroderma uncinatum]
MLESRVLSWLQGFRRSFLPVRKQPSAFTSDEVTLTKQDTTSTANTALWQEDYDIEKSAQDVSQNTTGDPQCPPAPPPSLVDVPDGMWDLQQIRKKVVNFLRSVCLRCNTQAAKVVQCDRPCPADLHEATFSFEGLGEREKYSIKEIQWNSNLADAVAEWDPRYKEDIRRLRQASLDRVSMELKGCCHNASFADNPLDHPQPLTYNRVQIGCRQDAMALPLQTIDGRYKLVRALRDGAYLGERQIQDAERVLSGEDRWVMVKLECCGLEAPSLEREADILESLAGHIGVPLVQGRGIQEGYRFIVVCMPGPSLDDFLEFCEGKFSLKTVLLLGEQLIHRVEAIHSRGLIHGGIRPSAFGLGVGKASGQVMLVEVAALTPTTELTQRYSDLEALVLMCIYMCRRLAPWEGLQTDLTKTPYKDILQQMENTRAEVLCRGLPRAFKDCLEYVESPSQNSEPDYNHLRELFRTAFSEKEFSRDGVFDWTVYKHWKNSQQFCQPVTGITDEVGSRRLSVEAFEKEHDWLVTKLRQAEGACALLAEVEEANKTQQYYTTVIHTHHALISWCIDILVFAQHPEVPAGLRGWPEDHQLPDKVWQAGIEPCLKLLEVSLPHTQGHLEAHLHKVFTTLMMLAESVPCHKEKWTRCIQDVSRYGVKHNTHVSWVRVYNRWEGSAGNL